MWEIGDEHREAELRGVAVALQAAGRVGLCRAVVNDLPRTQDADGGVFVVKNNVGMLDLRLSIQRKKVTNIASAFRGGKVTNTAWGRCVYTKYVYTDFLSLVVTLFVFWAV